MHTCERSDPFRFKSRWGLLSGAAVPGDSRANQSFCTYYCVLGQPRIRFDLAAIATLRDPDAPNVASWAHSLNVH